jgi:hypothetical protein
LTKGRDKFDWLFLVTVQFLQTRTSYLNSIIVTKENDNKKKSHSSQY